MDGRIEKVRVFFEEDLKPQYQGKPLNEINFDSFMVSSMKSFQTEPFVIFIDNKGKTTIIKNRWGYMGTVVSKLKLIEKFDKATNWEKHITEHEFNNETVSNAKKNLIKRLISEI